jgi:hypothetical protein
MHSKEIAMETYWDTPTVGLLFLWEKGPRSLYIGAYDSHRRAVYTRDGGSKPVAVLPDDLILDEALAAAKVIIMANRR